MFKRVLLGVTALAFAGGLLAEAKEKLPPHLKEVSQKTEKVTYYTYTVVRDGMKAEFPIVKVGNTYYGLPMKLVHGEFQKVEPKVSLIPVKADFLEKAQRRLSKQFGNSFVVRGEGKGRLYVVFDAFCPFCMKATKSGKLNELKEKYGEIVFLPLAVHGKESVKGLSCIYEKAKKEGVEKALKEVFGWKKGDDVKSWLDYKKKVDGCSFSSKTEKVVKTVSDLLSENGVFATPTFFYFDGKNYYKRVGIPDFKEVKSGRND